MSFILDALRKSESERQQDARPSITRIPDAIQQNRLPAWALGTIALLGVGVLVLAVAWWRAQPGSAPEPRIAEAPAQEPAVTALQLPEQMSPRPQRALRPTPTPTPTPTPEIETEATSTLRAAVGPETSSLPAPAIAGTARSSAPELPRVEQSLRDYAAAAARLDLPPLRLELHSFGDDAAKRFVFINGSRYREGDTLSEGPRLIAINSRGAVLLAKNQQLLLGQE